MAAPIAALMLAALLGGCTPLPPEAPASPAAPAPRAGTDGSPLGSPFSDARSGAVSVGTPLVVDRGELRIGTTVQYRRIPTPSEVHDLIQLPGLARIVLTLEEWPRDYASLRTLDQAPDGVEMTVVLSGWPENRAMVDIWNYLSIPARIIVIVPGPPPSIDAVAAINMMRGLERVIAQMDEPSRSGFERLQRPLTFRKIVE